MSYEITEPVPSETRNLRVCFGFASQPQKRSSQRQKRNKSEVPLMNNTVFFKMIAIPFPHSQVLRFVIELANLIRGTTIFIASFTSPPSTLHLQAPDGSRLWKNSPGLRKRLFERLRFARERLPSGNGRGLRYQSLLKSFFARMS